jgi:hypothetical protein
MPTSHTTPTYSKVDTWLLHHASALLTYAKTDSSFATALAHNLLARNWRTDQKIQPFITSTYLVPETESEAMTEATWLLQILDDNATARFTRATLSSWAQNYQAPKDLVLGIVGLAIIGPTLGLIQSKKKKRSQMQVVIDKAWYETHTAKQLTELVQNTSQKVISRELRLAGGNAFRLHPDTAAWCLEEPLTSIHLADTAELALIKEVAEIEKLSHETSETTAIAISPTVNDSFISEFAVTEIV